ncbi:MAG: M43 family zinc metalloprotease [Flavobacteriales bacterium]
MKHLLLSLAACSLAYATFGQVARPCGTDEERQRLIREEPGYLEYEARVRSEIADLMRNNASQRDGMTVYTIPIVFHVLHLRGQENISNEQILDAVSILNEDYRKLNADTAGVWPYFWPRIGDAYMEFRLPTIDPVGNCTNGIDRIMSVETLRGQAKSKINPWPREKYLNVWVNKSMGGGSAAGYFSGFPALADGIMILHPYVGGSGTGFTSDDFTARALSHEVGHFFSLNHVWGENNDPGGSCGDDGVEDTPITKGWSGCPTQAAAHVCNPDTLEMPQNYMDYSYCSDGHLFTHGQCLRMRNAANSPSAQRDGLWSENTLQETGIAEGYEVHCAPRADFYAMVGTTPSQPVIPFSPTVCTNTNVQFHDNSSLAFPTGWSWTFQDGTPATSAQRNPVVTFSEPGWKTVTLTVSNDIGSDTRTNEYAVLIGNSSSTFGPVFEGFETQEGASLYPYFSENYEGNVTSFNRYTGGGFTGGNCAMLNSGDRNLLDFIDPANGTDIDELISPLVDLTGTGSPVFAFRYAYSTSTSVDSLLTEKLEIFSSTDCGKTWQPRSTISGVDLVTNGNNPAMPPPLWKLKSITIPASVLSSTVRFRLRFTSSEYSGNLFIDDINMGTAVGMSDLTGADLMTLFPNPTNDHFTMQVFGMESQRTEVTITDLRGAVVYSNVYQPMGGSPIEISARGLGLGQGMYFLRASNTAGSSVQKLIVGR